MCECWDSLLCCFGCLTCLGCRDRITRKLVFFPPECTYQFEFKQDNHTLWLKDEDSSLAHPHQSQYFSLHQFQTSRRQTCTAFFNKLPDAKLTILFSHGNATDIGCMRDHLLDVSHQLNVNVFCYDYSGYGLSTGECSVANIQADIVGAFRYLTEELKVPENTVVLYGQSLGSGPTCYLASRNEGRNIRGVVLHSPLQSGIRVIRPNVRWTWFFDILPNIDWIRNIEKPVFIIHGSADREIPVFHGKVKTSFSVRNI
jgi:pimeloyl-ACP methyl ester carboxylesterase